MVVKGLAKPTTKEGAEFLQVDKVVTKVRIGYAQIAVDDTERAIAGEILICVYYVLDLPLYFLMRFSFGT